MEVHSLPSTPRSGQSRPHPYSPVGEASADTSYEAVSSLDTQVPYAIGADSDNKTSIIPHVVNAYTSSQCLRGNGFLSDGPNWLGGVCCAPAHEFSSVFGFEISKLVSGLELQKFQKSGF